MRCIGSSRGICTRPPSRAFSICRKAQALLSSASLELISHARRCFPPSVAPRPSRRQSAAIGLSGGVLFPLQVAHQKTPIDPQNRALLAHQLAKSLYHFTGKGDSAPGVDCDALPFCLLNSEQFATVLFSVLGATRLGSTQKCAQSTTCPRTTRRSHRTRSLSLASGRLLGHHSLSASFRRARGNVFISGRS